MMAQRVPAVLFACGVVLAEQGILVVHVSNAQERPIKGVVLSTRGDGSTGPPTTREGKTRIVLAPDTKPGDWVSLQVVTGPGDLVFVSPWDSRVIVPPFENESDNFASIVLAERGDRALLENPKPLAARINAELYPKSMSEEITEERRQEARALVASEYGLEADDVDIAIRAWGEKTTDPYEKGLAALYEENFPEASRQLATSLESREKAEAEAERVLEGKRAEVVDAARFLGQSLFREGRYAESAEAYRKAAARSEDDAVLLNDFAVALSEAASYEEAEPLYKRSLEIKEKVLGAEHPSVATTLSNLAELYKAQGRYEEAEPLYKRSLEISEKVLGAEHPDVATTLSNLALLYEAQGRYEEAEPLY